MNSTVQYIKDFSCSIITRGGHTGTGFGRVLTCCAGAGKTIPALNLTLLKKTTYKQTNIHELFYDVLDITVRIQYCKIQIIGSTQILLKMDSNSLVQHAH